MREHLPQLLQAVADAAMAQAKLTQLGARQRCYAAGERVVVRRDDGSEVVLMTKGDLESLEMTLEILSDPEARDSVEQARAEAKAGLAEPLEKYFPRPA